MDAKTHYQTLNISQVSEILDQIAAMDCNIMNLYADSFQVLKKYGVSESDFLSYCDDAGEADPMTEDFFARSLLACFLGGLMDVRDRISNAVINIGYAIGQTASGHYYRNVFDMPSTPGVVKRNICSNIYLKDWEIYRLNDLANKELNGRLRGNHAIGVYEHCDISDYDYAVYYATGGQWLDYDGIDWMANFYADFQKTPRTDAIVETVCAMLPKLYLKYDQVTQLHSSPAQAKTLADQALAARKPTMPEKGKFSENVFLDVAKKEFWICLFAGMCGFHKFYIGEMRQGAIYFLTAGGFTLLWLNDVILLTKKLQNYSNKREYLDN